MEEDQTFILSIDGDADLTVNSTGTQMSSDNAAVTNGTGTTVRIEAVQLAIRQVPADTRTADGTDEVVSGLVFETQPIVSAQDAAGNTDRDFTDVVTVTLSNGSGTISGTQSVTASTGTATFTDLAYLAGTDGETFTLTFDDETSGVGGDLGTVSTGELSADVVATQLVLTQPPADNRIFDATDEVVSGFSFTTQPVISAHSDRGLLDVDFQDAVTASLTTGVGALSGTMTNAAIGGVVAFSDLAYLATTDGENFTIRIDDESTGSGGDLPAIDLPALSADVIATQLSILQVAADSRIEDPTDEIVSSVVFQTQPVVLALDAVGLTDTDFSDDISISLESGVGNLTGTLTIQSVAGAAIFTDVAYRADGDGEEFRISFDDAAGGSGGDLASVSSNDITADVVATQLLFLSQTNLLTVEINQNFAGGGVTVTASDDENTADTDYADEINLLAVATGTSHTPLSGGILEGKPSLTVTPTDGQATWTELTFDEGDVLDLLAVSGSLQYARSQPVTVTLPDNNPPVVVQSIDTQALTVGSDPFEYSVLGGNPVFVDPDKDALTITALVDDPSIASAILSGSLLTVVANSRGLTTVTLSADDEKGTAPVSTSFNVLVTPPLAMSHIGTSDLPTIDGDLGDWELLFEQPLLIHDQFTSIAGNQGPLSVTDQRIEVWLGWNDTSNRLYVAARVTDDLLGLPTDTKDPSLVGQSDNMEVFVDADYSREFYNSDNAHAQRHVLTASGDIGPVLFPFALVDHPDVTASVRRVGTVYEYEWSLPGWDTINQSGTGVEHDLQAGGTIGIGLAFADFETQESADAGNLHGFNALMGGDLLSNRSDSFWPFQLAAPVLSVSTAADVGANVNVQLALAPDTQTALVSVEFDAVNASGITSLFAASVGPAPPAGFIVPPDVFYYDVQTTASFTGSIELCFDYARTTLGNKGRLALLHFAEFGWLDITTPVDASNRTICGLTSSLSTFTILQQELLVPVLVAFNGETFHTTQPTFDWDDVGGSANYTLEYATNNGFLNATVVESLPTSEYRLTKRLDDAMYYWRVRAVGPDGEKSQFSSVDSFVIIPTLAEWMMILLAAMMLAYGVWQQRRVIV